MPEENLEVVRALIEANRSGDPEFTVERAVALSDPRLEFRSALTAIEGATYQGHDGFRRYFADVAESMEEWRTEAEEIIEIGQDTVFASVRTTAVGKGSGIVIERQSPIVFVLSGGQVLRIHVHESREEALEAARTR